MSPSENQRVENIGMADAAFAGKAEEVVAKVKKFIEDASKYVTVGPLKKLEKERADSFSDKATGIKSTLEQ